jgi:hypothetical protein
MRTMLWLVSIAGIILLYTEQDVKAENVLAFRTSHIENEGVVQDKSGKSGLWKMLVLPCRRVTGPLFGTSH